MFAPLGEHAFSAEREYMYLPSKSLATIKEGQKLSSYNQLQEPAKFCMSDSASSKTKLAQVDWCVSAAGSP